MDRAVFPISGPVERPTADDYALEAARLRRDADRQWRIYGPAIDVSGMYALAAALEATARRKRWAESMRQQMSTQQAA